MEIFKNYFELPKPIRRFLDSYNSSIDYFNESIERCTPNWSSYDTSKTVVRNTDVMDTLKVGGGGKDDLIKVGYINQDTQASQVYSEDGISPTLSAGTHGYANGYVEKSVEIGAIRGRKQSPDQEDYEQTLETNGSETSNTLTSIHTDNVVVLSNCYGGFGEKGSRVHKDGISPALISQGDNCPRILQIKSANSDGYEVAGDGDSVNFQNPNSETRRGRVGKQVAQTLDTSCSQAVVQMNKSKESGGQQPYKQNRVYDADGISPVLDTECGRPNYAVDYRIRRLTPKECFRLMDFPENFILPCSDTQTYKQAGNGIVVAVLTALLSKLPI